MDERENQQRAIEETRERLGQVAGELASRANPPYVKARIREAAEKEAEIVKEAAAKKARDVREVAMRKAENVTGRVVGSPTTYSLLGALGGWLLGAFLGRRYARGLGEEASWRVRRSFEEFDEPSLGGMREPGIKERTSEAFTDAKERASDAVTTAKERASNAVTAAKDKASEKLTAAKEKIGGTVSHVREQIPSAHEISEKTGSFIHDTASTRPLLFALVPLVLGALFAMLLPVSDQERRALATAKQKVNERLSALGEKVEDRIAEPSPPAEAPIGPLATEFPH